MLELMFLVVISLLVVLICFLLYQIYKIKYTGKKSNSMFVPEIKQDDRSEWELKFSSRLNEIVSRLSGLEDKLQEQEKNIKRLAEALSSE